MSHHRTTSFCRTVAAIENILHPQYLATCKVQSLWHNVQGLVIRFKVQRFNGSRVQELKSASAYAEYNVRIEPASHLAPLQSLVNRRPSGQRSGWVGRPGTAADEERERHVHHHLQYQSATATATTTPWVISCPSTSPTSPTTSTHNCRPASGVRGHLWLKLSSFNHL